MSAREAGSQAAATSVRQRLARLLGRRVDASSLALFRILFGVLLAWSMLRKLPNAHGLFSPEAFHFTYALFPFVKPLPEVWMVSAELWVAAGCGVAIALGVWMRTACLLFLASFGHLFLIEKVYYNNHFYLMLLMTALLAASQADRCYSLRFRRRNRGRPVPTVPFWNLVLFRGQMLVVYFFGGLAKLNADWLRGEPARHWFANTDVAAPVGWFVGEEWFVWLVSYGGVIFDLSVGFLLLYRRTFWLAAAAAIGFHLANDQLFLIGVFPYMGIASLVLFMDPTWPRRFLRWMAQRPGARGRVRVTAPDPGSAPASAAAVALVIGWLGFQVLWPLRIHLYGQDPSWTEVGHLFSWRMMLRSKDAWVKLVFDPPAAEALLEEAGALPPVVPAHVEQMVKTPHFLLQYVHELDRSLTRLGMPDVEIRVHSAVSLNGRPFQAMIDPTVDLTKASYGFFSVPDWIVPLEDGRPGQYPGSEAERTRMINWALLQAGAPPDYATPARAAVGAGPRR